MVKRKRQVILVVAVGLSLLTLIFGGVALINKYWLSPKIAKVVPQTKPIIDPTPKVLLDFEKLQADAKSSNWTDLLSQSSKYADLKTNDKQLRISAYAYCVFAATKLKNSAKSTSCRKNGTDLIVTFTDPQQRDFLSKSFESATKGEKYVLPTEKRELSGG